MKRILVLTIIDINNLDDNSLYKSLFKQLSLNVHVDIVSANSSNVEVFKQDNVSVYQVKSKKLFKVNKIIKAFNLLTLYKRFIKVIKKHLLNEKYDLVFYSTPPITLNKTIKFVKKHFKIKSYLLLKDIFPQNAVDLNMFSHKGLIYKYFRRKEKVLYQISDFIGCMSQANIDYIVSHNQINKDKLELNYNSILVTSDNDLSIEKKYDILNKYHLPIDKVKFIYGGNLGMPQSVDFINQVLWENEKTNNHIIIVGSGTEEKKVKNFIINNNLLQTSFINKLPIEEYDLLVQACDVGLVFLDNRFTIPNIPSRMLSYLNYSKPVIAATDNNTDLKEMISDGNFGYWCESKNPLDVIKLFEQIKEDEKIISFGKNGRNYLIKNFDVKLSANLILNKIK